MDSSLEVATAPRTPLRGAPAQLPASAESLFAPARTISVSCDDLRLAFLKRSFDVAASLLFLATVSPFMLLIALLVKLDSRGPVFYTQIRVGRNRRRRDRAVGKGYYYSGRAGLTADRRDEDDKALGVCFPIFKFRSMCVDSEPDGRPVWCRGNDPRVTRIGNLLRKTHLDELPQLFNILRGEMSFVGPRPERPELLGPLAEKVSGYPNRLLVKPGLTGLAQIRHRADVVVGDVRRKVRYDLLYIRSSNLLSDLRIMAGTVPMMLGVPPGRAVTLERFQRSIKRIIFRAVRKQRSLFSNPN